MNYIFQITNAMWPFMMKFCTFKLLWIFSFIIISTTAFLVIVYKGQRDELKKYILDGHKPTYNVLAIETCNSVHAQLQNLTENLSEKGEQVKKSQSNLNCAERVLDLFENNKISSVNRYKELLSSLKYDLEKIEHEVTELQTEITGLSKQREYLKTDVMQQQKDYQKLFHAFAREFNIEHDATTLANSVLEFNMGACDSLEYCRAGTDQDNL